ncbi:MAG: hypothetical protein KC492_01495 [Myxococcales bacterium]|nr:hypothetical protein [Myxococcales bacterium]
MLELKPPTPFSEAPRPWFFLAGSIEMDRAERWQERLVAQLAKRDGSILNPRRDSWDASWRQDLSERGTSGVGARGARASGQALNFERERH